MIKNSRLYISSLAFILLALLVIFAYLYFLKSTKEDFIHNNYEKQALTLRASLKNMIEAKQKSTLGLAITLATHDKELVKYINKKEIPASYYDDLITQYSENTFYKNIWIQVIDTKGISLYRSWSLNHGDDLSKIRADIRSALKIKKPQMSISTGAFDISLKSIAPIFFDGKFMGLVEVISHFDSITKLLAQEGVQSIVVADEYFKKQLKHPWNKTFIANYYVSNKMADKKLIEYLSRHNMQDYFNNSYKIENGYLITSYLITDHHNPVGAYIMFEKLKDISSENRDDFILKWLIFGFIVVTFIAIVGNIGIYYVLQRQKKYYRSIINTSENMIIINNKESMTDVNNAFFHYFKKYKTLRSFLQENSCICEFFVQEDGYIQKEMNGVNWVDYLLQHQGENNKIKMDIDGEIFYFLASASIISQKPLQNAIILSDITEQEIYKHELEERSVTDPLTGVKNRRFYESRIQYEISRACRYDIPLSIIMFDIDHFKQVNDIHGHDVGDKVLIEYTELISEILRDSDTLCRIGGEEFVIIAPHTTKIDAYKLAEKIRKIVEKSKHIVPITMSFGVTEHENDEDKDSMFKRADNALYEAKKSGRNKVVLG